MLQEIPVKIVGQIYGNEDPCGWWIYTHIVCCIAKELCTRISVHVMWIIISPSQLYVYQVLLCGRVVHHISTMIIYRSCYLRTHLVTILVPEVLGSALNSAYYVIFKNNMLPLCLLCASYFTAVGMLLKKNYMNFNKLRWLLNTPPYFTGVLIIQYQLHCCCCCLVNFSVFVCFLCSLCLTFPISYRYCIPNTELT